MTLEAIQREVAEWPEDSIQKLQGFLVSLRQRRSGELDRISAKLDDPNAARWVPIDTVETLLGISAGGD